MKKQNISGNSAENAEQGIIAQISFANIPDLLLHKWQAMADLLADIICIPAALIMKTENEYMEVFISSKSENNPYHAGDKEKWYGLYCETVIKTQRKLLIPNATTDKDWDKNPDIKLGMIAYLGYPINFPDNRPFGTLCAIDNKEKYFSPQHEELLLQFKNVIELDLAFLEKQSLFAKKNEELKLSEARYKTLSSQLEAILDHIPGLVFYKDSKNNFIRVNKYFAQVQKKDKSELEGRNLSELYTKEIANLYFQDDLAVINSGIPKLNIEEPWESAEGLRWVNTNKIPFVDADGNTIGIIGISMDITERKQAEKKIELKNEQLEKSNAEKDKFFSIIAHDLRSPFNGFLGLTEIMAEGLHGMTLDEIREIAVSMKKSATNLYSLLENLLEWSLMKRGLTAFEPQLFLLSRKITESMVLVTEAADKKEIAISYDIPEDLTVFADRNMFEGVIRNLSSNAVKFTRKGGAINVSAKSMPDNSVEISFKDTGIGMNKEMIDNLFRLDIDTSRKGTEDESSTGLGLIICKDFIEKHGGKLWVESEEEKGSVFTFTIPDGSVKC
ncbi:MAG: ATP-binding protein [Ignavibacteriae bacterium]|nr:ATP-binding protein [Ignavibacteriota bacterium]